MASAIGKLVYESNNPDPIDHQLLFFPKLNLYLGKAGIGSTRFQKNATWYIQKIKPDLFICAGGAGALTADLAVGKLIVRANSKKIFEQFFDGADFVTIGAGAIASYDGVIANAEDAEALRDETGAVAVAQEGHGAFSAAELASIPCIELRAITDNIFNMTEGSVREAFDKNLSFAMENIAKLLVTIKS